MKTASDRIIDTSNHRTPSLHTAARCHPGLVRPLNEDSVLVFVRPSDLGEPLGLMIVADGVGGHKAGEVASRLAVETIHNHLKPRLLMENGPMSANGRADFDANSRANGQGSPWRAVLLQAVEAANHAIHQYALTHPLSAGNLGTTVACVLVYGTETLIANVGDSRVYHLRGESLKQVTVDHSLVSEMILEGHLDPQRQFDHPHRSIITRALGQAPNVAVDLFHLELQPGDRLLLCSDGLWEMVREDQVICDLLLQSESLTEAAETLIKSANQNGGLDNISVVIGEITST